MNFYFLRRQEILVQVNKAVQCTWNISSNAMRGIVNLYWIIFPPSSFFLKTCLSIANQELQPPTNHIADLYQWVLTMDDYKESTPCPL